MKIFITALDYQLLIEKAMLSMVRKILINTQNKGLVEGQCLYVSFRTDHPKVILSNYIRSRYPKEITIVLQYQYKNLKVLKDRFFVNITFSGVPETIKIPVCGTY